MHTHTSTGARSAVSGGGGGSWRDARSVRTSRRRFFSDAAAVTGDRPDSSSSSASVLPLLARSSPFRTSSSNGCGGSSASPSPLARSSPLARPQPAAGTRSRSHPHSQAVVFGTRCLFSPLRSAAVSDGGGSALRSRLSSTQATGERRRTRTRLSSVAVVAETNDDRKEMWTRGRSSSGGGEGACGGDVVRSSVCESVPKRAAAVTRSRALSGRTIFSPLPRRQASRTALQCENLPPQ
jgi:hypothetical protein